MPASLVTSRRLRPLKLRDSRSRSAAATMARRVASLRSSRDVPSRDERDDCDFGVRLFTVCEPYHKQRKPLDDQHRRGARYTHVHSTIEAAPPRSSAALVAGRPLDRPPRRRPFHRAGRTDVDSRRRPRQGRRRSPGHPAQRHADAGTESRVHWRAAPAGRSAREPHRRGRRSSTDALLLTGQRREHPPRRADGGRARRRNRVRAPLPQRAPRHGRRAGSGRRGLRAARRPAEADPLRLWR